MKYTETSYSNHEDIIKLTTAPKVAVPIMVEADGISADADGNKIVDRGTIVGGVSNPVLANLDGNETVEEKNTQKTAASLEIDNTNADADIVVTANQDGPYPGEDGDEIEVKLTDPSGNDQDLSVSVDGDTIDVSLATGGSGSITSTANEVIAAINAHLMAGYMVTAETAAEEDGSGVVEAQSAAALSGGNDGTGYLAEGVLVNDVDVTNGDAPGSMYVFAYIDEDKLDSVPSEDAREALEGITFISEG
jgi:hypothetical protein